MKSKPINTSNRRKLQPNAAYLSNW